MTRRRLAVTVAAIAADLAAGALLMETLREVGWPTLAALLRHYGLVG